MAEVTLTINGRNYPMACDDGEERRVMELGRYVDSRIKDMARAGGAKNENHLLILSTLLLADEIFELRDSLGILGEQMENAQDFHRDEDLIVRAIDHLYQRIDHISDRIQQA